jgi:drug/metabolite transporter (DMT)-like permease
MLTIREEGGLHMCYRRMGRVRHEPCADLPRAIGYAIPLRLRPGTRDRRNRPGKTDVTPRLTDAPLRGILLMCLAMACFVTMNTFIKSMRGELPVVELVWGRYFFHALLIMLLFPRRIPTLLRSADKGLQMLRATMVLLATILMFTSVGLMPIADVVAITFVAPLLIVVLSVTILREYVGLRRWCAVFVGFVGVVIILRPGGGLFTMVALLPLSIALTYAIYQIVTRMLARSADPLNTLFYAALFGAVVMSLVVPFDWVMPNLVQWGKLVLAGFLGGVGHYAIIRAYERAEVSLVAPFAYTELIWATLFGFVVFGNLPDRWTFAGAGIIALSGIYVVHREHRAKQQATGTSPVTAEANKPEVSRLS